MIVPSYWAEARQQQRSGNREVTLRRYGWSDSSQEAAQAHAEERLRQACARIAAGESLPRREPKVSYNGADGLPIREEVLSRHGDTVVTRNLYGARCLNTPDVLFADIDFDTGPGLRTIGAVTGVLLLLALLLGWATGSAGYGLLAALLALLGGYALARQLHRLRDRLGGGPEPRARRRIDAFLQRHPDWHLRLYRTPAGLRLLAMHRAFDAREPAVAECFAALGVDALYARMCVNQRCFRARVSPKPWRVGIAAHLRPRPGVWPVNPERLPERERWVQQYEQRAQGYAACRFVEALGQTRVSCMQALAVQRLHDEWCRAQRELPLA
ncbi:hypothetical protein C3942_02180 [Solimonas fluminis]|uniref:Transmembrane protein n=1 Tax=Solimonas fluminis TaxID=2086571 RepID=A0A2S5TL68_9GAMM|nr:hypothetical protein [Solimonas fluminis]PPE75723.1 hypothetical protein C3942_02180 [Solimonas fluminis]